MNPIVWVDGRLTDPDEPAIPALDHGLLVGDGVFETLRVLDGVPVALRRHLARLEHSAAGMGMDLPDRDHIQAGITAVLDAGGLAVGRLRVTVTTGAGPIGSARGDRGPCTVVIGAPATPWPPTAAVVTAPWPRNEHSPLVGLKTISYGDNVVALAYARAAGADEAILANTRGELCEGTGTNVFVADGGRLVTPPLSSGCLSGITRGLLIEHGLAAEAVLPADALARAEEAFLSSSTRGIHPIRSVDDRALPHCPGPLTEAAMAALTNLDADA